jgi:hypothetical protein
MEKPPAGGSSLQFQETESFYWDADWFVSAGADELATADLSAK